jgi:CheY-like chemotaxis protein
MLLRVADGNASIPGILRVFRTPNVPTLNAVVHELGGAVRGKTMSKKILVVDDSKTALMMEREILEKRTTYQCVTASDGQEAVEKAQQERPDLILMDVVMPRMNGFEACKAMRQQSSTREIPIVLVTTRGEESYMEAGFQSGCNDYITKPVNGAELVALIQSYLGE